MFRRWRIAMRVTWAILTCRRAPKALVVFEDTAVLSFGGFGWRYDPGDIELPQAKIAAAFATLLFLDSENDPRANALIAQIITLFKEKNISKVPDFSRGRGVLHAETIH